MSLIKWLRCFIVGCNNECSSRQLLPTSEPLKTLGLMLLSFWRECTDPDLYKCAYVFFHLMLSLTGLKRRSCVFLKHVFSESERKVHGTFSHEWQSSNKDKKKKELKTTLMQFDTQKWVYLKVTTALWSSSSTELMQIISVIVKKHLEWEAWCSAVPGDFLTSEREGFYFESRQNI